ncbi:MAG: reverse transcriptase-like protein, partial [Bifidobacteriaceae bacterium]|nr:reverse transcriptase-like protein [Bifidobacteriaceae bacterium]
MTRRLVIEADGGARGNPGVAGYGAVVRDGATGRVLAERAAYLGDNVTNNVAEYSGLIAGLEAAVGLDPAAQLEVRMDSRLVVSQMAGRWKIKNADLRDLVAQARAVMGARQVRFTWVPRADNSRADALANQAMDTRGPVVWDAAEVGNPDRLGGGAGSVPVPGGVGGDGDGVVDGLFPVPDAARGSGPPAVTPAVTAAAA